LVRKSSKEVGGILLEKVQCGLYSSYTQIDRYLSPGAAFGAQPSESFTASFKIAPGRLAFMSGLLPRRGAPLDGPQRSAYANTPLQVLTSPKFQSGDTDFLLLFLPQ
jgi:hypothetical protein